MQKPDYHTGHEELEFASDEANVLMSKPPAWTLQWGITIIFASILIILIGASLISYNDIIKATVVITTQNPPVYIEAKSSGRLTNVFVNANQQVLQNDILAVIENAGNFEHILELKLKLDTLDLDRLNQLDFNIQFPYSLVLGSIQQDYTNFISKSQAFLLYKSLEPNKKEQISISSQIKEQSSLLLKQKTQLKLIEAEIKISNSAFNRSKSLYEQKVISESDFENATKANLTDQQKLENMRILISNTQIALAVLENMRVKALNADEESTNGNRQQLEDAIQRLKNAINLWDQQYIVRSPIAGEVTLFDIWNKNQIVKSAQVLFTVLPKNAESIIGKVTIPIQNSGKVKAGQKVLIKLDNYPYQEWGSLSGKVVTMSAVPKQGEAFYTVYIRVDNLRTSFDKNVDFKQEMQGSAEIITEELSVLSRILYQIRQITQRN